jgi:hypothetical protein
LTTYLRNMTERKQAEQALVEHVRLSELDFAFGASTFFDRSLLFEVLPGGSYPPALGCCGSAATTKIRCGT